MKVGDGLHNAEFVKKNGLTISSMLQYKVQAEQNVEKKDINLSWSAATQLEMPQHCFFNCSDSQ